MAECKIEGCGKKAAGRGLCWRHYHQECERLKKEGKWESKRTGAGKRNRSIGERTKAEGLRTKGEGSDLQPAASSLKPKRTRASGDDSMDLGELAEDIRRLCKNFAESYIEVRQALRAARLDLIKAVAANHERGAGEKD